MVDAIGGVGRVWVVGGPEMMAAHLKAISAYSCGTWQDAVEVAQQVR